MITFRMIKKSITLNFDHLQTSHSSVFVLVHQPVAAVPGTGVCVFKRRLRRKVESGCSGSSERREPSADWRQAHPWQQSWQVRVQGGEIKSNENLTNELRVEAFT